MKHKKRYRWFKSHRSLHKRVCAVEGHTWMYDSPRWSKASMKDMVRRRCHCGAEQIGSWRYYKKEGWVFNDCLDRH